MRAKQEIMMVAGITLVAMIMAVILALVAATILDIDISWRLYVTTLGVTGICGPVIVFPLLHANLRLAEMKRELERLVRTDPLTGLPNRRAFFERANEMFAAGGAPLALIMVDIDRFKAVNDSFGHDAGDAVLKAVSAAIAESAREIGAFPARIGGEEFAVAVAGLDADGVVMLAERLCTNVRGTAYDHHGTRLAVTVSVGMAMRAGAEPVDAVLKLADGAVYEAKHRGRDRWHFAARPAPVALKKSVRARPRAA